MTTQPELSHEIEIKRELAVALLGASLRRLAANLMRIVRGAGKPNDLAEEMAAALTAFKGYQEAVGKWPSSYEISEALSVRITEQDWRRWCADGTFEQEVAFMTICQGALQTVASQLLSQPLQIVAGEREVYDGVFRIERAREERRKGQAKPRQAVSKRKRRPKSGGDPVL